MFILIDVALFNKKIYTHTDWVFVHCNIERNVNRNERRMKLFYAFILLIFVKSSSKNTKLVKK